MQEHICFTPVREHILGTKLYKPISVAFSSDLKLPHLYISGESFCFRSFGVLDAIRNSYIRHFSWQRWQIFTNWMLSHFVLRAFCLLPENRAKPTTCSKSAKKRTFVLLWLQLTLNMFCRLRRDEMPWERGYHCSASDYEILDWEVRSHGNRPSAWDRPWECPKIREKTWPR